jgi:hypothetical protein
MDGLDKCEQLLADSSLAVAILHNPVTSDFELVPVVRVEDDTARCYTARGLQFSGCIGLVAGQPQVALDVAIVGEAAQKIVRAFVDLVEDQLNGQVPKAESVDWLTRLLSLPDPRAN